MTAVLLVGCVAGSLTELVPLQVGSASLPRRLFSAAGGGPPLVAVPSVAPPPWERPSARSMRCTMPMMRASSLYVSCADVCMSSVMSKTL